MATALKDQSGKLSARSGRPLRQRLFAWFDAHLDDPATQFRERTVRAISFVMLAVAAILAVLPPDATQGSTLLPLMASVSLCGMTAAIVAIHFHYLTVASWLVVLTLLVDAVAFLSFAGYAARVSFPLFMIVFLFSTLVLPRTYLWILLVVTLLILTPILNYQATQNGVSAFGVLIDIAVVLIVETVGLYIFRLEFDSRLEAAEKARQRAEEADRLKTQFLSNVSHELRTPLNAIIGYTELIMSGIFDPEEATVKQAEFNPKILNNARNLRMLVDDLLDLAKIQAGMSDLKLGQVNPRELAAEVVENQQGLVQNKPITLSLNATAEMPEFVQWDAFKVNQIMTNLIGNAIKFTNQGSVTVFLSTSGPEHISIAVADTGIGMKPGADKIIFEKFRQMDDSDRRVHGGTGLGLAITKGLVDLMGGSISVKSELNKGSTFTVTLPCIVIEKPLKTRLPTS